MAKNKFFSWENWWKGFVTTLIIGVIGLVMGFISSVLGIILAIILSIAGFVFLPLIYSAIIRAIYKK